MRTLGFILLFIVLAAIAIALFILSVHVIVWNVGDITVHGVSFWNIFWLWLLALLALLGVRTATK